MYSIFKTELWYASTFWITLYNTNLLPLRNSNHWLNYSSTLNIAIQNLLLFARKSDTVTSYKTKINHTLDLGIQEEELRYEYPIPFKDNVLYIIIFYSSIGESYGVPIVKQSLLYPLGLKLLDHGIFLQPTITTVARTNSNNL